MQVHQTSTGVSRLDWVRWALLSVMASLHEDPVGYFQPTAAYVRHMDATEWGHLLPATGRWDTAHRGLVSLEKRGYVERTARPALWAMTWQGKALYDEFIAGNPNITPEKARLSAT